MRLFPYLLLRIAPQPLEQFDSLGNCLNLNSYLIRYSNLLSDLDLIKKKITDMLFEAVKKSHSLEERTRLLTIKRLIIGDKVISIKKNEEFPAGVFSQLLEYNCLITNITRLKNEVVCQYQDCLTRSKKGLSYLVANENFLKGLLLSSPSLFSILQSCLKEVSDFDITLQPQKFELSICKYLSRIFSKTSPFSYFTSVCEVPILKSIQNNHDVKQFSLDLAEGYEQKNSVVLNSEILKIYLVLLKRHPIFYENVPVRVNPTMKGDIHNITFLINVNLVDVFQRAKNNHTLNTICDLLLTSEKQTTLKDLILLLSGSKSSIEEQQKIGRYLQDIVSFGIFEYDIQLAYTDPKWDALLVRYLQEKGVWRQDSIIQEVCTVLQILRQEIEKYQSASSSERQQILKYAHETFFNSYLSIHEKLNLPEDERKDIMTFLSDPNSTSINWKSDNTESKESESTSLKQRENTLFLLREKELWYEDTRLEINSSVQDRIVLPIVESIQSFLNFSTSLNGITTLTRQIEQLFKNNYLNDDNSDSFIGLIQFYHDFLNLTDFKEIEKDSFSLKLEKLWETFIEKKWTTMFDSSSGTANIEIADFNNIFKGMNTRSEIRASSKTAIVQFYYSETSSLTGVLNGVIHGNGKMFSRFLHLLDSNVTTSLLYENQTSEDDTILIENVDSAFSNVNIHPNIFDYQIHLPGTLNSVPKERQVNIKDIEVYFDSTINRLGMRLKGSKTRVKVLDVGIQNSLYRSKFFNFIKAISEDDFGGMNKVLQPINEKAMTNHTKNYIYYPRISIQNNLILQRKTWIFKMAEIPQIQPREESSDYFLRINEWRLRIGLPDRVFIRIMKGEGNEENEKNTKQSKLLINSDDYKPQYINYGHPLLVNLLSSIVKRSTGEIMMEEMLPDSSQLFKLRDHGHVTEFCIQWKN